MEAFEGDEVIRAELLLKMLGRVPLPFPLGADTAERSPSVN